MSPQLITTHATTAARPTDALGQFNRLASLRIKELSADESTLT
jgi:hypothetical protein